MNLQYWEYNVLQLNHPASPKLLYLSNFLTESAAYLEGDYVEIGVYKGKSFLALANMLADHPKTIDSKKCWAYDTFTVFPPLSVRIQEIILCCLMSFMRKIKYLVII